MKKRRRKVRSSLTFGQICLIIVATCCLSICRASSDTGPSERATKQQQQQQDNTMISEESEIHHSDPTSGRQLDDLLAVESINRESQEHKLRLLTIGKQPPYATSTPANSSSNKLTFKNSSSAATTKSPIEILRPAPLFIRISSSAMPQLPHRVSPIQTPFHYPTANLASQQQQQQQNYQNTNQQFNQQNSTRFLSLPQNSYAPITPTSTLSYLPTTSSVWSPQMSQVQPPIVVFVSANANSISNANATSQLENTNNFTDWSALARYLNVTNNLNQSNQSHDQSHPPGQLNWFSSAHKSQQQQLQQQLKRPTQRLNASEIEYLDEEYEGNRNATSSFPKLINHSSEEIGEEEFNRKINPLSQLGTYQKTNTSNMSWNQLLKQASGSNIMESLMVTNKSTVSLLCDTDDMLVRFKFRQPFRGFIATNLDRFKSCRLLGTGNHYYEMKIPLLGCGTRQEMPRLFINNLNIQFHPSLDSSDDETKTIICSYPIRPKAPPPPDLIEGLPERIIEQPPGEQPPARLIYYEPVILIAGLLLLSLTLLGLTAGAYVLTNRNRRRGRGRNSTSWSSSGSFNGAASSRLYRAPPAQTANMLAVKPPVVGFDNAAFDVSRGKSSASQGQKNKTMARNRATVRDVLARRSSSERRIVRLPPNRISGILHPNAGPLRSKSLPQKKATVRGQAPVPVAGARRETEKARDSLASSSKTSDESSVTTIEIPYSSGDQLTTPRTRTPVVVQKTPPPPAKVTTTQTKFPVQVHQRPKVQKVEQTPTKTASFQAPEAKSTSPTNQLSNQIKTRPAFGSIRRNLTSPKEYERLESIARLFPKDPKKQDWTQTTSRQQVRWPTKYQHKIATAMSDEDRRLIGKMFHEDEIFRSRVVDSTNRETFSRKLRDNPLYASKLKRKTWDLLEEIILDQPVDSSTDPSIESNEEDNKRKTFSRDKEEDELSVVNESKPKYAKVTSRRDAKSSASLDDNESVIIKIEGNQKPLKSALQERQPIASSTRVQVDHGQQLLPQSQPNDDSLESKSSDRIDSLKEDQQQQSNKSTKLEYLQRQRHELIEDGDEPCVRVSQFNSTRTRNDGGLTGTLINIDSVTDFTSSRNFSTFTRSSIEHTRYEAEYKSIESQRQQHQQEDDDPIPFVDEKVASYEYTRDRVTHKRMPSPSSNK